jgi:hypothetical protein
MTDFPARDLAYVIRVDEVLWGGLLLAFTVAIHGVGMFAILRVSTALRDRVKRIQFPGLRLGIVILVAWMIVAINLTEVLLWAAFFVWKGAQPNGFSAFYNAVLNYTTLQAGYLPVHWRLLEGMLGMAGLITFAWSTGTFVSIAQELFRQAIDADSTVLARRTAPEVAEGRKK